MARGRERHAARRATLAGLGRELSRRARSACELCGERTSLEVVEVAGGPAEPERDWALMLCERCRRAVEGGRDAPDPAELRLLETAAWSELRPVQITAVRLARRLSDQDLAWARELLEGLYLDEDVEALL